MLGIIEYIKSTIHCTADTDYLVYMQSENVDGVKSVLDLWSFLWYYVSSNRLYRVHESILFIFSPCLFSL